jgi:type IV secretion system protein VirB9
MPEIDYLNSRVVPLTPQEKKALKLSKDWSRRTLAPVLGDGGKVLFVHGASLPTIIAAPMRVCDVELQPGEAVNEIVVGDSARWMVVSGNAGSGPSSAVHLFIKPVDSGLETSAVVTTDRRVYHLRLVSQRAYALHRLSLLRRNASTDDATADARIKRTRMDLHKRH